MDNETTNIVVIDKSIFTIFVKINFKLNKNGKSKKN